MLYLYPTMQHYVMSSEFLNFELINVRFLSGTGSSMIVHDVTFD